MGLECSFCGKPAKYTLGLNQYCCQPIASSCPANIEKFNEETKKYQLLETGIDLEVVNVAGFRSNPKKMVNNDMVQVTLKMSKTNWNKLQAFFQLDYQIESDS